MSESTRPTTPDDEQDNTRGLDVEAVGMSGDGPFQDRPDCDQQDRCTYGHGECLPGDPGRRTRSGSAVGFAQLPLHVAGPSRACGSCRACRSTSFPLARASSSLAREPSRREVDPRRHGRQPAFARLGRSGARSRSGATGACADARARDSHATRGRRAGCRDRSARSRRRASGRRSPSTGPCPRAGT